MPSLKGASRKGTPLPGQPQKQAPSSYPADFAGSGAAYLGTAPMPAPAQGPGNQYKGSSKRNMHVPKFGRNR